MIPIKEDRQLFSSGVEESIAFGISSSDSVHIMGILRDQLYSDKVAAVIREICANAADANEMAGRGDQPIEVTLPTLTDPTLRIRDCGPGLSLDEVRTVFSQYGASTKRDSNSVVGMLGIGSKSPFAYADAFVVVSWHGGYRTTYNAVIDPSGAGRIDLLGIEECDPGETGLEVQMAVRPADCKSFEDRARSILVHFEPLPKINLELPSLASFRAIPGGRVDDSDEHGYNGGNWTAVMGRIPYPISLDQLERGTGGNELKRAVKRLSGKLDFAIGELTFAASREALKYSDGTRALLIQRLNQAVTDYVATMLTDIDSLPEWEKRLRVSAINHRSLPVPSYLRHLADSTVDIKHVTAVSANVQVAVGSGNTLGLQTPNYNGRLSGTTYIPVNRHTRLILKNERRAMPGYALNQHNDIIVVPAPGFEDRLVTVAKGLRDLITSHSLNGIPTVMLSEIKWTKPVSNRSAKPRDREKARARVFVLDVKQTLVGSVGSEAWTPEDRVPTDSDVFVILESYRVPGNDDFYETVREDEAMLRNLGLKMPPILGYKSTKAKPVGRSDVKGIEYRKWRREGMADLLLGHPDVSRVVSAMGYLKSNPNDPDSWFQGMGADSLAREIGADHPIVAFAAAEKSSKMAVGAANTIVQRAAKHVRLCSKTALATAGDQARSEIIERYPLLAAAPAGALVGAHKDLWVKHYIGVVDSTQGTAPSESQEAAA